MLRRCAAPLALAALGVVAACATPMETMKDAVRYQAQGDLVCDVASLQVINLRPVKKVSGSRQGTVERGTFSAKGCGDYATYVVECIRGVCRVERERDETLDAKKKKPIDEPTEESAP